MKIIRDSASTVRFDAIKWGRCFIHEKGVYIRTKGADRATNLLDGGICNFDADIQVQSIEARLVIEDKDKNENN